MGFVRARINDSFIIPLLLSNAFLPLRGIKFAVNLS
jgi:hypothetical protein